MTPEASGVSAEGTRRLPALSSPSRLLVIVVLALVLGPFLSRLSLLKTRGFNPDELEHLHWSYNVASGLVPYLDYFDHHTPWLHFFFAPFFAFYDVERVPDEAIAFIMMARRWMWLFSAAILGLTFWLAAAWKNARIGLVSTLLLANVGFFLAKSVEVRPAVPAAALLLASVLTALYAVRRASVGVGVSAWRFMASGVFLGAATMFTQKILFVGPGFALVSLWFVLDPRLAPGRARRSLFASWQLLGFLLPVAATIGWFARRHALWQFVDSNIFVNTRWPGLSAGPFLVELFRQDPLFVLLFIGGFVGLGASAFGRESARRGEPVLALATLSMVATLPSHPAMSYQHFLLVLPLASLYAGFALVGVAERVTNAVGTRWPRLRASDVVLTTFILLLSVGPLLRFRASFDRGNWGTLQGITYVLRNTAPWETTFDGFTGLGLFRPQAFFHHFQHPHAFALQSEEEHAHMLEALRTGRAIPKLVFWSHYLRDAVTPEIGAFLKRHYVATGLDPILVRPFDNGVGWWADDTPRPLGWDETKKEPAPHVLFDDGWRPPTTEYGAPVRRTRTRSSALVVPIRRPRDFDAVFRAHADAEEVPFGVELVVNGHGAGVLEAVPRWQDYSFFVPVHWLRPGFNDFELRFSAAEDRLDRRLELAVNYLQLVPANDGR